MAKETKPNSVKATRDDTLIAKLAWIVGDMPHLKKAGWNKGQNFHFISVEQMKKEVIPRCADLGILIYPSGTERVLNYRDRIDRNSGDVIGQQTEVQLLVTWTITDGTDEIFPVTVGEALDVQDKAANKASTGAQKNLFKTVFGVTEDDEDNDSNTPVRHDERTRPAAPRQAPAAKKELTPEQKQLLALRTEATEMIKDLSAFKMVTPAEVMDGLIADGKLNENFSDSKNILHRAEWQEVITAVRPYLDAALEAEANIGGGAAE